MELALPRIRGLRLFFLALGRFRVSVFLAATIFSDLGFAFALALTLARLFFVFFVAMGLPFLMAESNTVEARRGEEQLLENPGPLTIMLAE